MNAGTINQTVTPILAIVATPNFKKQQNNQTTKRNQKKRMSFHSYNQSVDTSDEPLIYETTNCYGANGKPVVRNVSYFNKAL